MNANFTKEQYYDYELIHDNYCIVLYCTPCIQHKSEERSNHKSVFILIAP